MTAAPKIKVSLGELPSFWDRNVIFFSNIHSIFYDNVEGSRQLIEEISGAPTYGSRVLSILDLLFRRRPNLILLEREPDHSLTKYLSGELGLSLPDCAILDHRGYRTLASTGTGKDRSKTHPAFDKLRQHAAPWIDGFVTDSSLIKIAAALKKQTISSLEGSRNGNNKYLLYRHQLEQKLPVFDTLIASDHSEIPSCLRELRRKGYAKAVIKAQIGASGYGMAKVATENYRAETVPKHLFFEGVCMVQGWIEDGIDGATKIGSPSVQLFLSDDTLFLFDLTEQVLSQEGVHEGNVCPPPYISQSPGLQDELIRQAAIAGVWLHRQGYRGTASTDFLVVRKQKKTEVILCEINARVTGATYPAVLARHFNPRGAWYMRNIGFRKGLNGAELLSLMDQAGALYRPGAGKGIIPFNFNTDKEGQVIKGQFLCLGEDINACAGILVQAWAQLPVEWGYERD